MWDGAGGQLSVGVAERWGRRQRFNRIVVTGMDDRRDEVASAFGVLPAQRRRDRARGMYWEAVDDGFEAWLGDIHSPL